MAESTADSRDESMTGQGVPGMGGCESHLISLAAVGTWSIAMRYIFMAFGYFCCAK